MQGQQGQQGQTTDDIKAPVFIEKTTVQRLLKEVRDLMKSPLEDEGIYYMHSQTDMLVGYAMLIGPEDTLYDSGFYFFKFIFPTNYPYAPPVVEYLTNDGKTRFHPNLYVNKKTCLSILNTWRGEQWTSCLSIRTILLTLISILDKEPLLHEPGVNRSNEAFNNYHELVQFKNYDFAHFALLRALDDYVKTEHNAHFLQIMHMVHAKSRERIAAQLTTLAETVPEKTITSAFYKNEPTHISYKELIMKQKEYDSTAAA